MSMGTPNKNVVNLPHQKWYTEMRAGKQKTKTLQSVLFHFSGETKSSQNWRKNQGKEFQVHQHRHLD